MLKRPIETDWKIRRADYLYECGRLDQLKKEGLEHFTPKAIGKKTQNANV